jgi:hypothetical protein
MNPMALMLIGLGVGASLMYLTDPQTGNRRGIRKAGDAAPKPASSARRRAAPPVLLSLA